MVEWQGKDLQNPQHGFPAARDYASPIDASDNCGLRIDDFGSSIGNPFFY
jgi:hypothetical protein